MSQRDKLLKVGIEASNKASNIILSYYKKYSNYSVKNKYFRDLVSEVDIIAEKEIKKIILKNFPSHKFEGEETGSTKNKSAYKWIVDPIDGTVNYIHGIPLFAISIGLEIKGEIYLGIINNPVTNEIYYALNKQGAFLNGRKINVSKRGEIKDSLLITTFSSETNRKRKNKYKIFGKMNDLSRGCLRIGSASLGLAYLASGKVDGLWGGKLKKWDIAAGICILKEAGGKISNIKNKRYSFGQQFVASNNIIHKNLISLLKGL